MSASYMGTRVSTLKALASAALLVLFAISILTSCGAKKPDGEYNVKSATIDGITYTAQEIEEAALPLPSSIIFDNNGKIKIIITEPTLEKTVTIDGTYTFKGKTVTLDVTKWETGKVDGRQIIFSADDGDVLIVEQ